MSEVVLGAKALTRSRVADAQVPVTAEIIDPDILTLAPVIEGPLRIGCDGGLMLLCERVEVTILDEVLVSLPILGLADLPSDRLGLVCNPAMRTIPRWSVVQKTLH